MGFFDFDAAKDAHKADYDAVHSGNQAHLSHELIAGAAAYEAAKAYQEHQAKNGEPQSHEKAKEILAGLAGAFATKLVESKGRDFFDKKKAEHEAKKRLENHFDGQF